MNIMKTNMLLLENNKIRKDDAENTNTVAAPVPSTTDSKSGMKALMFQGMQNLMANPALAKGTGVVNDDTANENTAKSYVAPYSSNVAFKGGNFAGKFKQLAVLSAMALLTAGTLSSCRDVKEETNISVEVNVDQSAMMALIAGLQSQFTQALLNQQITIDMFNKYMEQTEAWRNQVNQRMANLELILTNMADQIFDIKNDMNKGFNENNAYQQMIVGMLEQFMTRDEAIALFNKLLSEVASGRMTVAQALAEILKELNLVNTNLNTIIDNQNRAYEQMEDIKGILSNIEGNTAEARDIAAASYERLGVINNTIVDGNNKVVSELRGMRGDMNFGFAATANAINMSTYQLGEYINKGVMSIITNNNWTSSMVIAAINYNTQITQEGNDKIEKFYQDFKAGLITAEEFARKILETVESIDNKMSTLIEDFNNYASKMEKAAAVAIKQLKTGNKTTAEIKDILKDVIDNQQSAYAMLEIMNQNIDKLDADVNAGFEAWAKQIGCSTAQIISTLQWLGYSQAQINSWIAANNTAAIINAIKGASDKLIATLGDKINVIIEKIDNGTIDKEDGIAQIIALLEQISSDVSDIKGIVADLSAKMDALLAKVESVRKYAKANYYENKYQSGVITYISGELKNIGTDVQDIKTTEEAILEKLENGDQLTAEELEIIIARLGKGIHQDMSDVKALLRADVAQNGVIINLIAKVVRQLDGLGSISQEILNEIANIGDDLDGLQDISDKIDALIEAVNNLSTKFDKYAESALEAHAEEIKYLKIVKDEVNTIIEQNQRLINQVKKANIQLNQIDGDITNLKKLVKQLEKKMGRSITPEELDSILAKHDAANQEFYAKLISKTVIDPKDYTDALDYLTKLAEILVTGQGKTNEYLLELIELAKKYPEYKDQIIEAIQNIKIEVTCECDCEDNEKVHEGILKIVT